MYDFENEGALRDNKCLVFSDDPLVQEFFAAAEKRVAILNSIQVGAVEMDIETALAAAGRNSSAATGNHGKAFDDW